MDIEIEIKKLVINECACYSSILNGIKNYCDREKEEDCRCLIFKDKRCGYFEKAVLPMNPKLEALYRADIKAKKEKYELTKEDRQRITEEKSSVLGKVKIRCKRCGKTFQANYRNQQYCEFCKRYIRRKNQRDWISKKRNTNVDNQLSKTVDI